MEPSHSTICYEATQRIYRPAVVGHIRAVFQKNFPESWKKQLRGTVGPEEWDKNAANVRERQTSGELRTKIIDDFDLLDIAHFYNLFDKFFELLFRARDGESTKELSRRKR